MNMEVVFSFDGTTHSLRCYDYSVFNIKSILSPWVRTGRIRDVQWFILEGNNKIPVDDNN